MQNLSKKLLSPTSVKFSFLQGSNFLDSLVFGNAGLGEIKRHRLTMAPFQKNLKL